MSWNATPEQRLARLAGMMAQGDCWPLEEVDWPLAEEMVKQGLVRRYYGPTRLGEKWFKAQHAALIKTAVSSGKLDQRDRERW